LAEFKKNKALKDLASSKKKATRYIQNHPLSCHQAWYWCFAAIEQGYRLSNDALQLHKSGSNSTAMSLLILAIEEFGKPAIIFDYMVAGINSQENWNIARKKLTNHEEKLTKTFEELFRFLTKRKAHRSACKMFRELNVNPIEAIKIAREAFIYTSAYEDSVLTPPRFNELSDIVPVINEILALYRNAVAEEFLRSMPKLFDTMMRTFNSSDLNFESNWKDYEFASEKYLYLISFLQAYFTNWPWALGQIWTRKKLVFVTNRICRSQSRRKYRVTFEILKNHASAKDETLLKTLLSKDLPKRAESILQFAKGRGHLLQR
jgi:AbiV family abortive infection protein